MPPEKSSNQNISPDDITVPAKIPDDPNDELKQIRTFQGDVASALQKQKESIYSIQQAERARSEQISKMRTGGRVAPTEYENPKNRKVGILLFVGIILLLILAGVVGFYSYTEYKKKTALPVIVSAPENRFIATASSEDINILPLDRESFIDLVRTKRATNNKDINHLVLKKGDDETAPLLTTEEFLVLLRAEAPGSLVRSFNPLSMFGILGGSPSHTFLLIKLDSYENAFAGMLAWETNLKENLLPLFATDEEIAKIPGDANFVDISIQNKDARALKNSDDEVIFLYSFFDNDTLVITGSEGALKSLIQRLTAQKLSR